MESSFIWWFAINPRGALPPQTTLSSVRSSTPIPFLFYDWIFEYPSVELIAEDAKTGELIHEHVQVARSTLPEDYHPDNRKGPDGRIVCAEALGYAIFKDGTRRRLTTHNWIASNAFDGWLSTDEVWVAGTREPDLCNGDLVRIADEVEEISRRAQAAAAAGFEPSGDELLVRAKGFCHENASAFSQMCTAITHGTDWSVGQDRLFMFLNAHNRNALVEQIQFVVTVPRLDTAEDDAQFIVTGNDAHGDEPVYTHLYHLNHVLTEVHHRDPERELFGRWLQWQSDKRHHCPR